MFVGLYVRLKITETPAFQRAMENNERVRVPMLAVLREHTATLLLATVGAVTTFVVFYLMTVFTLSWGTTQLGFARQEFLLLQIVGVLFFAATDSAVGGDRRADRPAADADRSRRSRSSRSACCSSRCSARGSALDVVVFLSLGLALHGADVRTARHGARRAVSDRRALHGRVGRVQSRGHPRRLARAVHRDLARRALRDRGGRLLPVGGRRAHVRGARSDRGTIGARGASRARTRFRKRRSERARRPRPPRALAARRAVVDNASRSSAPGGRSSDSCIDCGAQCRALLARLARRRGHHRAARLSLRASAQPAATRSGRAPAFAAKALTTPPTTRGSRTAARSTTSAIRRCASINRDNVAQLKPKWRVSLNGSGAASKYSAQAQPLVYDGVIYLVTGADDVFAVDAETGGSGGRIRRGSTRRSTSSAAAGRAAGSRSARARSSSVSSTASSSRSISARARSRGPRKRSAGRTGSRSRRRRCTTTAS